MRMPTNTLSVQGKMEAATGQVKRACGALLELARRYQEVIVRDPELAGRLESGFRLASYLVPGLLGGSWAVSETAYSVSNLYTLLNDYLVTSRCPSASPLHRVRITNSQSLIQF